MAENHDPDAVPTTRSVQASSTSGAVAGGRAELAAEEAREPRTEAATTPVTRADASVEPTRIRLDPTLDEHPRRGVSGGTWIALILGAIILVLLLIFILQNIEPADFAFFGLGFSLPLGVAMLFAAIAGVLITALLGSVRLFKLGRRVRRLEKERQAIRQALR